MRPIAKVSVRAVRRYDRASHAPGVIIMTITGPLGGVIAGEAISIAEARELHKTLGAAIAALEEQPDDAASLDRA